MATYRHVQTGFWQDAFVMDLTPEEKYFYLYLLTNSKTSQCGIYELPKRIMETETGYNRETIDKLIKRFIEYGKIRYDEVTKEIVILNWVKYNSTNSPKVKACINKELERVKNKEFVSLLYGNDSLSEDYGEKEKEKEKQKENDDEDDEEVAESFPDDAGECGMDRPKPFLIYEQNIGVLTPVIAEDITKWLEGGYFDEPEEIVVEAISIAVKNGARKWSYASKVLIDWKDHNLRTLRQVQAYTLEFERLKGGGKREKGSDFTRRADPTVRKPSITGGKVGWVGKDDQDL